jgi:hypothetical protein
MCPARQCSRRQDDLRPPIAPRRIKPGDDFVEVLSRQVDACEVMLAVIGPAKGLPLAIAGTPLAC